MSISLCKLEYHNIYYKIAIQQTDTLGITACTGVKQKRGAGWLPHECTYSVCRVKGEVADARYPAEQVTWDGLLIELAPALCQQAGYRWAVRLSRGVAELLRPTPEEEQRGQSVERGLSNLLWNGEAGHSQSGASGV